MYVLGELFHFMSLEFGDVVMAQIEVSYSFLQELVDSIIRLYGFFQTNLGRAGDRLPEGRRLRRISESRGLLSRNRSPLHDFQCCGLQQAGRYLAMPGAG